MIARDTQFAGFAKMMVDELIANSNVEVIDSIADLWEQQIARRAHDLVWHTILNVHPLAWQRMQDPDILKTVTDMKEWEWREAPQ